MKKQSIKLLTYLGIALVLLHFFITFVIRVSFTLMPNYEVALFWYNTFGLNDLFENLKFYQANPSLAPLNQFYYIASFTLSLLATLIVGRGRNIIEILGIIVSFGIPQKRKSWGKVYNSATNEPLPFVSIRIIQNDENGHFVKVIQEIVSDVEGNYRVSAIPIEDNIVMQARLSGFTTLEIPVLELKERTTSNDIIEDISLSTDTNAQGNNINTRQKAIKVIYRIIVIALYILSLLSVITISFYALRFELSIISLQYNLAVAVITLIWNTYVIFNLGKSETGMVLDKISKKTIPYTTLKIYKENKQVLSKVVDKTGKLSLPLKSGVYTVDVFKDGYLTVQDQDIEINSRGYIKKNIYLEKDPKSILKSNTHELDNPFTA